MSDEEKKAIEILNKWLCKTHSEFCKVGAVGIPNEEFFATEIVLSLIEKQSKEIEELKEKNKRLEKFIENGEHTWKQKYNETFKYVENEFVSKDKIKAILEEYKYTEIGDSEKIIEFYKKIQSLLEKE